jgi:hypothetical protein
MAAVMIGVDPHRASHTAVVIGAAEEPLGEVRVRACAVQAERLLVWAAPWPERAWAIEGADGVGHLLAQQLLAPDEARIAAWRQEVWPVVKGRRRTWAPGSASRTN